MSNDAIKAAESRISAILHDLETETGMLVEEISLVEIEATAMADSRREFLMRPQIEMRRLPGHRWAK